MISICSSVAIACFCNAWLLAAWALSPVRAVSSTSVTRLYRQYRDGDFQGAIATQKQIVKTDRDLAAIPGIPALKALLKMRGVIRYDNCRGPLRPLSKEEYEVLERVLDQYYKEEGL